MSRSQPGHAGEAPAIALNNLVVTYPASGAGSSPRTAVAGVSFTAAKGSVIAILGPNGAGKTTTVETLEGYRRPSSGTVRVLGLDPITDAKALAPRIGVMLQRDGVYLTMGPRDVLRLFAGYYEGRAKNPDEVLNLVGLTHVAKTPWRRLSGGEQQRLKLAMAIIGSPEVIFLDEPTAAVDADARIRVREIVSALRSDGSCVVLTTHELDEAERLSDHLVIMDHGKVVAEGSPDELRRMTKGAQATEHIRFGAPAGIDVRALGNRLGTTVTEDRPGEYRAETAPTPATVAALTAWLAEHNLPLADLRAGRARLEDVFLQLTSGPPPPTNTGVRQPRARGRRS
jgi:ABC-2 type transport system ATP-binding protein